MRFCSSCRQFPSGGAFVTWTEPHQFNTMSNMVSRLVSLTAACTVLLSLFACDGGTALKGYVRDAQGVPVVGASITMSPEGNDRKDEVHSDENGAYSVSMLHAPGRSVIVNVSKPGSVEVEHRFHSSGEVLHQDFTLRKIN
jgi:hypothetical protein